MTVLDCQKTEVLRLESQDTVRKVVKKLRLTGSLSLSVCLSLSLSVSLIGESHKVKTRNLQKLVKKLRLFVYYESINEGYRED
jgi:hypothetical protein